MTTITFKQTECVIRHEPDQPPTTLPPLPDTANWPYPKPVPCPAKYANDGKCIITVKNPLPARPVNADYQITEFHDDEPWNITLGEMLIRLGQKVIQGNQRDEWLSMVQVASLCRKYRLKWQGGSTKATKLEQATKDYLEKNADIMGSGVKLECKTEFNEDRRRDELFLKFRRLYPDGLCH